MFAIANVVDLTFVDYFKEWVCIKDHILKVSMDVDWVICEVDFDETSKVCKIINSLNFEHSVIL